MDGESIILDPTVTANNLETLNKKHLIDMVLTLTNTVSKLQEDYKKVINLRLYNLERNMNMSQQYHRRDTLEISGIPSTVKNDEIENEVIEIFKEAKMTVNHQNLKIIDIQVAHRIGQKGKVIVKVVNRKCVRTSLVNKKNLNGSKRYGDSNIYLNDSFIPEFSYFNYLIRCACKDERIKRYKVRNGVNFVQEEEDEEFMEIGHAK